LFAISEIQIDEFFVELGDSQLVRIDIQPINNTLKVVLRPVDMSAPPYLVQNLTTYPIKITRQVCHPASYRSVETTRCVTD
jgi:hypothetical protein